MQQMTSPLRRINRAKENLDILNSEIHAIITSIRDGVSIKKDPKDSQKVLGIDLKPLPPTWGFIVGEIAHGLRCALDNIAFNIATTRDERTTFPICKQPSNINRMLKKFPTNLWDDIKVVQPYNAPNGQQGNHPLWILRRIDDTDKHRRVAVDYFSDVQISNGGTNPKIFCRIGRITGDGAGTEIKSPLYSNLKDNLKPDATTQIVFDISCPPIEHDDPTEITISNLFKIHDFVRYDVYPRFAKLLRLDNRRK